MDPAVCPPAALLPCTIRASQQQSEVLSIQNLVKAAGVYALAALDLCGSG